MNKIKIFFNLYKKQCILMFCILAILVIFIGGSYYYFKDDKSQVFLADSVDMYSSSNELIKDSEEVLLENKEEEVIEQKVRVDIKGQVVNPGVYTATIGDRIIDIINYAGGLLENADTSVNNLSRRVTDEMVIIIYSKEEVENFVLTKEDEQEKLTNSLEIKDIILNDSAVKEEDIVTNQDSYNKSNVSDEEKQSQSSNNTNNDSTIKSGKISLNKATKTELMKLNGIGSSKAEAIIKYRNENGGFNSIEDIMKVKGIGEKVFAKIKDSITL